MNRKFVSHSNYIFRKVINNPENVDILKNLVESILNIKIDKIELNPYLKKIEKNLPSEENFGIADVRIKTENGEKLNVGIQFIDGTHITTKMLLYYAQVHLNQLEYSEKREFAKTITINFLDFNYYPTNNYEKNIKIKTSQGNIRYEDIEMKVIELRKFSYFDYGENITDKERWIEYIRGSNNKRLIDDIVKKNQYIRKLDRLLDKYWEDEKME